MLSFSYRINIVLIATSIKQAATVTHVEWGELNVNCIMHGSFRLTLGFVAAEEPALFLFTVL